VTYPLRFLPAAEAEFLRLPRKLQVELKELRPYLEANPYRAYPFLPVKGAGKVPGVWRFPLGPYRVFYKVDRVTVWLAKFWLRPPPYDRAHIRELRRAFGR
jgi:mRNA-degrading endonuclease RelE of RelBE toxin-antitoxin system